MAIKLFISDLDGTLLKNDVSIVDEKNLNWSEEISLANINAIEDLHKHNIKFGIATGRMLGQVEHINQQIDNKSDFIVTQNGNYIYDENMKLVSEDCFSVKENLEIINYIRDFGFKPFFLDKETIYIDLRYMNYDNILKLKVFYKNNYIQMLNWKNPWEIKSSKIKPGMVSLDITRLNETQKLDLANVIQEDLKFTKVSISSPFVIDIYPLNSSKFAAISKIAETYNLSLDEIAFIGDSGNDVSVFTNLKHTFCMNHARDDVKVHASKTVSSVQEAISEVLKYNEKN